MSHNRGGKSSSFHSQIYLDNLKEFLESRDWRDQLSVFVKANCLKFANVTEYTHEHHQIWQDFISIAESILSMGMEMMGGSLEKLESAIEEIVNRPSTGPRDEQIKDLLNRLLSFHDFDAFANNMNRAAEDLIRPHDGFADQRPKPRQSPFSKYKDDLMALGFEEDMIQIVCEGATDSVTLEQLVMTLSELGAAQPSKTTPSKITPPRHNFRNSPTAGSPSVANNSSSQGSTPHRVGRTAPTMKKYYDDNDRKLSEGDDDMADYNNNDGAFGYRDEDDYSNYKNENDPSSDNFVFTVLNLFIREGNLSDDSNELYAKFSTAKSITDMLISGKKCSDLGYDSTNQNSLVDWSTEMLELYEDIGVRYEEGLLEQQNSKGNSRFTNLLNDIDSAIFKEPQVNRYGKPFFKAFNDLEKIRMTLNETSKHGMLSDYEMKRMAELDKIASTGTDDEKLLHSLISRFDTLQKEINDCHKNVTLAVASNRSIDRVKLEELYLYLKELVNSGTDISQLSDELFVKVVSVSSVDSATNKKSIITIVGILLDMHILEDEQYMLRRKIDNLVSPTKSSSSQYKDESPYGLGEVVLDEYGNNIEGEYGNYNQSNSNLYADDKGYAQSYNNEGDLAYSTSENNEFDENIGNEGYYNSQFNGESKGDSHSAGVEYNEYKSPRRENDSKSTMGYGNESKNNGSSIADVPSSPISKSYDSANVDFINSLKSNQKIALHSLKSSMEAEKTRRLSLLEDKLKKKKMRQGIDGIPVDKTLDSLSEAEIRDLVAKNVSTVEREISDAKEYFEVMQEGLISGYKQLCMAEMKESKVKGRPMNEEELECCRNDVLKAMKEKHEREQKSLIEGLEFERQKQKQRIMKNLAAKKQKLQSQHAGDENSVNSFIAEEMRVELENLNNHFDGILLDATSKPQNKAFMAMSAVMIDENLIKSLGSSKLNDDDDDDYLEDGPKSAATTEAPIWLESIESSTNGFIQAGHELQSNLLRSSRQYADELSMESRIELLDNIDKNDSVDSGASELGSLYSMQVVNNSFAQSVSDLLSTKNADLRWHKKKQDEKEALESIKHGLINEFKKSQSKYSEELESARTKSLRLLASKRAQTKKSSINSHDAGPSEYKESVEVIKRGAGSTINSLIDSFLDTPIEISSGSKIPKVSAYGATKAVQKATGYKLSPLKTNNYVLNPFTFNGDEADSKASTNDSNSLPSIHQKFKLKSAEEESEMEDRAERDKIKQRYSTKEKELVDGLYSQMVLKKQILQEKLRKKQEERDRLAASQGSATSDLVESMDDDDNESDQIKKLESAFEKVVLLVQSDASATINLDSAIETMNALARGEVKTTSEQFAEQVKTGDIKSKELMKEEAKRIASTYNEEKEKYDLMMKMQQARQRQNLQRKLMEKKQQQLQQGEPATGGLRLPFGAAADTGNTFINEPTNAAAMEHHRLMKQMTSRGLAMQNLMRR